MTTKHIVKATAAVTSALRLCLVGCAICAATTSCSDWNDHYDEAAVTASTAEVYAGDIVSYLRSNSDLSRISQIFEPSPPPDA